MKLNKLIDHTYLKAFGTKKEIDTLLEEAKEYDFKSVCVNPCHVHYCKEALKSTDVLVCTVIGFPLGANTKETKVFETLDAVKNGADEIDMVMNIGAFKEGSDDYVRDEIESVVKAAGGRTVKVIIETCYLDESEVIRASKLVGSTKADFIKTSTGFGPAGATPENVRLMKEYGNGLAVKAAGGVRTGLDLEKMVAAGATRIGTSNGVQLMKNETGGSY